MQRRCAGLCGNAPVQRLKPIIRSCANMSNKKEKLAIIGAILAIILTAKSIDWAQAIPSPIVTGFAVIIGTGLAIIPAAVAWGLWDRSTGSRIFFLLIPYVAILFISGMAGMHSAREDAIEAHGEGRCYVTPVSSYPFVVPIVPSQPIGGRDLFRVVDCSEHGPGRKIRPRNGRLRPRP